MKILSALLILFPLFTISQENQEPYYQDENFVTVAFDNISVENFRLKYGKQFQVSKKPVQNTQDPRLIDTIYTFQNGKTIINFYKGQSLNTVESATITSGLIDIGRGIKIGQRKEMVLNKLKLKTTPNKFQVGDLERTTVYTFEFNNGMLSKVEYEGYVD